jgi:hypothetical protein
VNNALDNGESNAGSFKLICGMVSLKDSKQLASIVVLGKGMREKA